MTGLFKEINGVQTARIITHASVGFSKYFTEEQLDEGVTEDLLAYVPVKWLENLVGCEVNDGWESSYDHYDGEEYYVQAKAEGVILLEVAKWYDQESKTHREVIKEYNKGLTPLFPLNLTIRDADPEEVELAIFNQYSYIGEESSIGYRVSAVSPGSHELVQNITENICNKKEAFELARLFAHFYRLVQPVPHDFTTDEERLRNKLKEEIKRVFFDLVGHQPPNVVVKRAMEQLEKTYNFKRDSFELVTNDVTGCLKKAIIDQLLESEVS